MKNIIKDYFSFNKSERNGIIVLMSIIVALVVASRLIHLMKEEKPMDFGVFEKEIDDFMQNSLSVGQDYSYNNRITSFSGDSTRYSGAKNDANNNLYNQYHHGDGKKRQGKNIELFNFDPNTASDKDWDRLGLSDKQIKVIRKYQAKGGVFRENTDLEKMYCITGDMYAVLEPYIRIAPVIGSEPEKKTIVYEKEEFAGIIELNSADSAQLVKLKGIGPYFARSIIKYRDMLGGFLRKEQLLEVYNFKQETFDMIKDEVVVDQALVKTLNINTSDADKLSKHPYINWKYAKEIVRQREKTGSYSKTGDILLNYLMPEADFNRVKDYLSVD